MSEPNSPSLSSVPPDASGDVVGHQQLSDHPLWARARGDGGGMGGMGGGGGRGGGRGRPGSEQGDATPIRRARLSVAALELEQLEFGDGADSAAWSDEERDDNAQKKKQKKKKKRPRSPGSFPRGEDSAAELDVGDSAAESDAGGRSRDRMAAMMGAAVGFGEDTHSDAGESASEQSEASSKRRRAAAKQAYPVRGVGCVGCVLNNRISVVDRFVRAHLGQMTEDALWKMAALTYLRDVAEPAKAEGAPVPSWSWKEVRLHYEIHSTSNLIQRHKKLRFLQNGRLKLEGSIVRIENGQEEVDRASYDLALKSIGLEMKLRDQIDASMGKKERRD